jgi:hypothetical protein
MSNERGGVVQGGDAIRSALRWLAERRLADPSAPRLKLIEEVALRYDLTPLDADFLARAWKE